MSLFKSSKTMSESNNNSIGCLDLVLVIFQALFVGLKLCGVISWSWGAVLIPLWIFLAIIFLAFIVYCAND